MKSTEFCYWLQGLFELTDVKTLDAKQTQLIKNHLALVFKHEIDPSYGDEEHQQALQEIHDNDLVIPNNRFGFGGRTRDGQVMKC